jgi:hypothetical protein
MFESSGKQFTKSSPKWGYLEVIDFEAQTLAAKAGSCIRDCNDGYGKGF